MSFLDKLKSRKLWVTILTGIVGLVYPEAVPFLKILVPTYVAGQAAVDAATALKGPAAK